MSAKGGGDIRGGFQLGLFLTHIVPVSELLYFGPSLLFLQEKLEPSLQLSLLPCLTHQTTEHLLNHLFFIAHFFHSFEVVYLETTLKGRVERVKQGLQTSESSSLSCYPRLLCVYFEALEALF